MAFDPTKPIQTNDGKPARIICMDRREPDYPIVAAIGDRDDYLVAYSANGSSGKLVYGPGTWNQPPLVNIPERVEGWINVYRENGHSPQTFVKGPYPDRTQADNAAASRAQTTPYSGTRRIACLPVAFDEGEGLLGSPA